MFTVSNHNVHFLPGGFENFCDMMKEINLESVRIMDAFKMGEIFFSVDENQKTITHLKFDFDDVEEDLRDSTFLEALSRNVIAGGWIEFQHTEDCDCFRVSLLNNKIKIQDPVTVWTDRE